MASTCGNAASVASAARPRLAQRFRFGAEVADQLCHLGQVARIAAVAEHVGGERDIAEFRQHPRPRHREIAEPEPLVEHQHAGPPPGAGFVKSEIAAQIGRTGAVIDVLRLHRLDTHS